MLVFALVAATGPLRAEDAAPVYRLGLDEQLSVRILAWNDTQREYMIWSAASGDYRIQADGTVLIPIAGQIQAAGLTTVELSDKIAAALQAKLRLVEPLATTVEIVNYRPFYILGDVAQPGAYPARPGLTVAQAVALAGGLGAGVGAVAPRTILSDSENLNSTSMDIVRSRVRKARIQAELDNVQSSDEIAFPDDLRHPDGDKALADLIAEEKAVFASRIAAHELQVSAVDDLQALLRTEIENLQARMAGQKEQVRLARESLQNVETLFEKGLTSNNALADSQRRLIETEGRELDMQNTLYRARQQLAEATRDLVKLQTSRETQAMSDMQQVNAGIEKLESRRTLVQQFLADAGAQIDPALSVEDTTSYELLKEGASEPQAVAATFRIAPGDILTVIRTIGE